MISHVAVVPHPPLLVPQLSPGMTDPVRQACLDAVSRLGDRWIAVGAHDEDLTLEPSFAGTFAGFGTDVPVSLSSGPCSPRALPLPALVDIRHACKPALDSKTIEQVQRKVVVARDRGGRLPCGWLRSDRHNGFSLRFPCGTLYVSALTNATPWDYPHGRQDKNRRMGRAKSRSSRDLAKPINTSRMDP